MYLPLKPTSNYTVILEKKCHNNDNHLGCINNPAKIPMKSLTPWL